MSHTRVSGRPAKSAAVSAEKPSIIFGRAWPRKLALLFGLAVQALAAASESMLLRTLGMSDASAACPLLVLDTNVVLDWLVFEDASCAPLAAAVQQGRARWIASMSMRQELEHVLTRENLKRWQPDSALVLRSWDRWAHAAETSPILPNPGLICTDPDDQKFIDLAMHARADALISRDRALLRLARRARHFGIQVVTATAWAQRPALLESSPWAART